VPIPAIDTQMLSTLEVLHYCRRFQDTLFAFSFSESRHCEAVLMDLRILLAARIRQVIFCAADEGLTQTLRGWNRSGDRFSVVEATTTDLHTAAFIGKIQSEITSGKAPLIALKEFPKDPSARRVVEAGIMHCGVSLGAKKVFFPADEEGLEIDGKFRSYPALPEVREAIASGATFNVSPERLSFLIEQQELHDIDVVMVQARRGAVYEEVFTHAGSGTLFSREYPNILRPASENDVRDIMAIMQPYITEGTLKPVTEEQLLGLIRSFMVYSVNEQIVAAAALIDYGDSCELAKLCTLPRYQARGRARALVRALLEEAKSRGKSSVFALTVQPHVAEFFEKLGFHTLQRELLPEKWKAEYDFSRPSVALQYLL